MKNVILIGLLLSCILPACNYKTDDDKKKDTPMFIPLQPAPKNIERFKEIAVFYNEKLPERYNSITPEERVLLYYLYRASLPGNRILAEQLHEDANTIIDLFYTIISHKDRLTKLEKSLDIKNFIKQAQTYFVYVWTNHGQYFEKEHTNNKRTPARLGLNLITPQNLITVLSAINYPQAETVVESLDKSLFDQQYQPTTTIPNNIEQSASNFYGPNFTETHYQSLSLQDREKLNNYFFLYQNTPQAKAYSVDGKCDKELTIVSYWLEKAHEHASKYPQYFDEHLVKSLELLNAFFQSGNEEFFKHHSIEWLKSTSRISYTLGFIETYKDPKGIRGAFQGEGAIKSIDLSALNKLLPELEQQMPIPQEFKRSDMSHLPNASINCKVFGTGDLGPLQITAAYCLPNYDDIRATHGSKQIIYENIRQLALTINPEGYRTLFFSPAKSQWLKTHSPDCSVINDIWDLHCILHETIGHGSGNNKDGDLDGYEASIEELRAEIIALYILLTNFDQLTSIGFLEKWTQKISRSELLELAIHTQLHDAFRHLLTQADGATEVAGAHAQADWTIFSYLLDRGCFAVTEDQILFNKIPKTVLGITSIDTKKTITVITELMQEVQRIRSTGDGQAAQKLIDASCKPLKTPQYITILKENLKTLVGDLKVSAILHPIFTPIKAENGEIVDTQATWPKDIFELARYEQGRTLSNGF